MTPLLSILTKSKLSPPLSLLLVVPYPPLSSMFFSWLALDPITNPWSRPFPQDPIRYLLLKSSIIYLIMNHESRLAHQTQLILSDSPLAAHSIAVRPFSSPTPPNRSCGRGRGRGFRRGQGGDCAPSSSPSSNFFTASSTNRPMCQVCQKMGHTTLNCFHRFNQTYQSPPPQSLSTNFTTYPHFPDSSHSWFPNTVATNHFTVDFSNLNLDSHPYHGIDQISIGDGSSISIRHSSTRILPTPSGNFLLCHLFHVSSISCNLLYVHQFCLDNSVSFEFNSSGFLVKDLRTQKVLLRGPVKDGL